MNSMTFASARPLAAPTGEPLTLTATVRRFLTRVFAPRRAEPAPLNWRQRAFDAAQVRRMAVALQHVDPGMAGDLYAAADRHQSDAL